MSFISTPYRSPRTRIVKISAQASRSSSKLPASHSLGGPNAKPTITSVFQLENRAWQAFLQGGVTEMRERRMGRVSCDSFSLDSSLFPIRTGRLGDETAGDSEERIARADAWFGEGRPRRPTRVKTVEKGNSMARLAGKISRLDLQ
jgi:hypothetical protein